jgi:hypothetical protein
MTEFEIITLLLERRVEMIQLMQWWGGVSFAIVAGSQVFESKLNWRLVILIEGFYLLFTLSTMRLVGTIGEQFEAAFVDLRAIEQPSQQALAMLNHFSGGSVGVNSFLLGSATLATVVVTCAYPVWLMRDSRKSS